MIGYIGATKKRMSLPMKNAQARLEYKTSPEEEHFLAEIAEKLRPKAASIVRNAVLRNITSLAGLEPEELAITRELEEKCGVDLPC